MPETPREAFERGQVAGEVNTRLGGHDDHLARVNGHLSEIAIQLKTFTMVQQEILLKLQQVVDGIAADRTTMVATAKALKESGEQRREVDNEVRAKQDQRWSPLARVGVAAGIIGVIATIVIYLVQRGT
jgi:hypothetical protein